MSSMIKALLITLVIALVTVLANADPQPPAGPRLREIVAENFPNGNVLIGATTGSWAFGQHQGTLMDREFSYVTPENDFKQSIIHPNPNSWNWSMSDPWIQHILDNRQILRMHCPISPQCSNWAKDDSRTAEELERNMREFAIAVCRRYNGQPGFKYMDVVNETITGGQWHKNKAGFVWECPWFKIGQDTDLHRTPLYIKYAFEIANQYAPDVKLIYNQHETEISTASWNLIKDTIQYLRRRGLRVDGIGWQAHINAGWDTPYNLNKLSELIKWAHSNDLEFHITEASAFIDDNTDSKLKAQAQTYRNTVAVLLEERRNGRVGWNTWHISDAHGWRKEEYPSLFDERYAPKPAYYAVQAELAEHQDIRCDFNLDRQVDMIDLGYLVSWWLKDVSIFEPVDLHANGQVDMMDYAIFSQYWLKKQSP